VLVAHGAHAAIDGLLEKKPAGHPHQEPLKVAFSRHPAAHPCEPGMLLMVLAGQGMHPLPLLNVPMGHKETLTSHVSSGRVITVATPVLQ
jgi:hypothetical protein